MRSLVAAPQTSTSAADVLMVPQGDRCVSAQVITRGLCRQFKCEASQVGAVERKV
ncbi:hypothetical protein [Anaplasma marginale]|uniref:hypothetical protein n=1 Tax=Anaplasma marginale TaxID=770 RepID=UPI001680419F|nr:hypothetical protein [Anaplasma marginale]